MIEETETFELSDVAPWVMSCACSIFVGRSHETLAPLLILRSVTTPSGEVLTNAHSHAVYVTYFRNDRGWSHHESWPDIEKRCLEEWNKGLSNFGPAFNTIKPGMVAA